MNRIKLLITLITVCVFCTVAAQEKDDGTTEKTATSEEQTDAQSDVTEESAEEETAGEETAGEEKEETDEAVATEDEKAEETAEDTVSEEKKPAEETEEAVAEKKDESAESAPVADETTEQAEKSVEPAPAPDKTAAQDEKAPEAEKSTEQDMEQQAADVQQSTDDATEEKKELKVSMEKNEKAGDEETKDEKKKDKKKKGIRLGVVNAFRHNLKKDRPVFTYSLLANAGGMIPKAKIGVRLQAGMAYNLSYGRPYETNPDENQKWKFDGLPLNFTMNRGFQLPWKINVAPTLVYILPVTSHYLWTGPMQARSMINVMVNASRSFKVGKSVSINVSATPMYSYGWNKEDYWIDKSGFFSFYTNSGHTVGFALSGTVMYKDFSGNMGLTYSYNIPYERDDIDDGFETSIDYKLMLEYTIGVGYKIKGFNFGINLTTAGLWRMYRDKDAEGGDRYLYPFDPEFTNIMANIGYNYSF